MTQVSAHERAVMDAQAGLCSHGGHGWDGEACEDIPAPDVQREATPAEREQWQRHNANGYATGRADGQWKRAPGIELDVPAEVPGETGAQYVARNLRHAWRVGYVRGYEWGSAHPLPYA